MVMLLLWLLVKGLDLSRVSAVQAADVDRLVVDTTSPTA